MITYLFLIAKVLFVFQSAFLSDLFFLRVFLSSFLSLPSLFVFFFFNLESLVQRIKLAMCLCGFASSGHFIGTAQPLLPHWALRGCRNLFFSDGYQSAADGPLVNHVQAAEMWEAPFRGHKSPPSGRVLPLFSRVWDAVPPWFPWPPFLKGNSGEEGLWCQARLGSSSCIWSRGDNWYPLPSSTLLFKVSSFSAITSCLVVWHTLFLGEGMIEPLLIHSQLQWGHNGCPGLQLLLPVPPCWSKGFTPATRWLLLAYWLQIALGTQ